MSGVDGRKILQAKHVSDVTLLEALDKTRGMHGVPRWSTLGDVCNALSNFPRKIVLAKLRSLIKRDIIDGCGCGCRGDFEVINDPRLN